MVCRLPQCTTTLAVGFYNVGFHTDWTQKQRRLKMYIAEALKHHALDILCLSARGQRNESPDLAFEGGTKPWIEGLIADSVELRGVPISIYNGDHYVTIVKNTRVYITHYKIVRD